MGVKGDDSEFRNELVLSSNSGRNAARTKPLFGHTIERQSARALDVELLEARTDEQQVLLRYVGCLQLLLHGCGESETTTDRKNKSENMLYVGHNQGRVGELRFGEASRDTRRTKTTCKYLTKN